MGFKKLLIYLPLLFIYHFSSGQIPSGYYNAAIGKTGDSLRKALSIITATGHNKISYSNIWNFYDSTDIRTGTSNKIWDMYSDIPGGTPAYIYTFSTNQCTGGSGAEGTCYSREHCFPNSWWGGFDDINHMQYSDLHHLFPADQYVNQYKSNNPLGQVSVPTKTFTNSGKYGPCSYPGYTANVYEPINAYKGDFARAYFYIATRYADSLGAWAKNYKKPEALACIDTITNNFKPWFRDMLLLWHNNDPVSTKEINRNNVIYRTYQHNRNPFIDHPEYVNYIWNNQAIVTKIEPSNYPSNFSALTSYPHSSAITLIWTDATGTVTPDGYVIKLQTGGSNLIQNPVDSIPEINTPSCKVVTQGTQTVTFTGLIPETIYYFKIYSYTNSGISINYKTNGTAPISFDTTLIWKEDFENAVKAAYFIDTNVNGTTGRWTLNDALIGTSTSDRKTGVKSVRGRAFSIYMNSDKAGGAGNISFKKAIYGTGTDSPSRFTLLKSTNGGINWVLVKDSINVSDTILSTTTISVNQTGNIRFMLATDNGSGTRRINIDDIIISNFSNNYKNIKIKCFLEGLFNGLNMNPAQNNTGNQWGNNISDKISIYLRDSISPFPIVFSDTNVFLDLNGNAIIDSIPKSLNNKYYLIIKHRNHLETWSSFPISLINDTTLYDFTTNATQAYGNNLKYLQTGQKKKKIYSKDYTYGNLNELKKLKFNPERFTITIRKIGDSIKSEIIILDLITKKRYRKVIPD